MKKRTVGKESEFISDNFSKGNTSERTGVLPGIPVTGEA